METHINCPVCVLAAGPAEGSRQREAQVSPPEPIRPSAVSRQLDRGPQCSLCHLCRLSTRGRHHHAQLYALQRRDQEQPPPVAAAAVLQEQREEPYQLLVNAPLLPVCQDRLVLSDDPGTHSNVKLFVITAVAHSSVTAEICSAVLT